MASKRKKKNLILIRLEWAVQWFMKLLNDKEVQQKFFEKTFWLALLISLMPLIFSFEGLFGSYNIKKLLFDTQQFEIGWIATVNVGFFIFLSIIMLLLPLLSKIQYYVFCVMTPILATIITVADKQDIFIYKILICAYLLSAAFSLGAFARGGRFLSFPVGIFALICLADSIGIAGADLWNYVRKEVFDEALFSAFQYKTLFVGNILGEFGANIIEIVFFLFLLMALRFVVHLVSDNRPLAKQLWAEKQVLKSAAITTVKIWWLVPVVFLICVLWLYPKFDNFIENASMKQLQDHLLCVDSEGAVIPGCRRYEPAAQIELEYEPMMRALVDHSANVMEIQATAGVNKIAGQTIESVTDVKTKMFPVIANEILPPRMPGTATRGCGRMNIPCHAGNGVKSLANSGYRRLRDPPLRRLESEIESAYVRANNDVTKFKAEALALIKGEVAKYRLRANIAIDKALFGIWFISIFTLMYSLMVLFKTFGIAFARVIFNTNGKYKFNANLDLGDKSGKFIKPTNIKVRTLDKSPYTIRVGAKSKYYIERKRQVAAGLGYWSIPYIFKGILKRLRSGKYAMQYYNFSTRDDSAKYGVPFGNAERVIELNVEPGQKVVFDFPCILAFSSNLKIKTFVTLSLHGLVFGKAIYRVAEGEGRLLFCMEDRPSVLKSAQVDSADNKRDPKSVVAWQLDTPFKIQSKLSWYGLLFSGYNISKQKGGMAIIDNRPISGGGAQMGIGRFVRTFLSPV